MLSECANKLRFPYINSRVLQQKQKKNQQEKKEDWLTLEEDGEVEMEDYFIPVAEVTELSKRQREDSGNKMNEV